MDEIKIQNFSREHPGETFPDYETLSASDAKRTEVGVREQLKAPSHLSTLDLVKLIREKEAVIPDSDADSNHFDLQSELLGIGITPNEHIYINWHQFDQVDRMRFHDLSNYFDDIWYPAADDIDLFDDTFSWIFSVGYSGELGILKLS